MAIATPVTLSGEQRDRLDKVQKLLSSITDPRIAPVAAGLGYDDEEHARGWLLWEAATGYKRPFSHALMLVGIEPAAGPGVVWTGLDRFENKWVPRSRNAIRRFVPAEHRDQVLKAFFLDLQQQPEGPLVVGSVSLFLERIEGLRTSEVPGATDAWKSLVKKGLDDNEVTRINGLLAQARQAPKPAPVPDPTAVLAVDGQAQLAAYDALNLWYIDWADALRDELPYHDRLRLGVSEVKGGPKAKTADDAEPVEG